MSRNLTPWIEHLRSDKEREWFKPVLEKIQGLGFEAAFDWVAIIDGKDLVWRSGFKKIIANRFAWEDSPGIDISDEDDSWCVMATFRTPLEIVTLALDNLAGKESA